MEHASGSKETRIARVLKARRCKVMRCGEVQNRLGGKFPGGENINWGKGSRPNEKPSDPASGPT